MEKAGVAPFRKESVQVLLNFKEILKFITSLSNCIFDWNNSRGIMVLICPRLVYVAVVITSLSTVSKKHQSLYRQGNCRNCDMLSPKSPVTHKQIENYNCYQWRFSTNWFVSYPQSYFWWDFTSLNNKCSLNYQLLPAV